VEDALTAGEAEDDGEGVGPVDFEVVGSGVATGVG
jgi:hypothetical protein